MATGFDIQTKTRYFTFWSELKPYVDGTSGSLAFNWAYTPNNTYYLVITEPYVGFNYVCYVENTSSAERTDFETNYKNLALRKASGSFVDVRLVSSSLQEVGIQSRPIWITGSVTTAGGSGGSGGTVTQGNQGSVVQSWYVQLTNGTTTIGQNQANALFVTGIVTASIADPSVAGTGSLAPYSASLLGIKDNVGNIRAVSGDSSGAIYTTMKEDSTTGTLGALNAELRLALSGSTSAGFQLAAGTLVGTLAAETSYDNGTTWAVTGFFDIDTKGLSDTIIFASANTAQTKGVVVPQGGGLVRVRVSAYTSGTANGTLRVSNTAQQVSYVSLLDGRRITYAGTTAVFTPAATATDVFVIQGSATKTIRVLKIELYATQTTAGAASIFLIKRSTANTAGTAVATTKVPFDSTNPAATATVQHYTANPTVGTTVGNIQAYRGIVPAAASLFKNPIITWTFGENSGQSVVLRGTTESLAINLNSVTITGGSLIARAEWTEE